MKLNNKLRSLASTAAILFIVIFTMTGCADVPEEQVNTPSSSSRLSELTFELSDNVTRERVTYKNRYGIDIAGDLYLSKDIDKSQKYPALVIGPPYGGVKEQGPGVYANELAQRGFVVLAFDPSYNGDSGGSPRDVSSPEIFVEDFSAGVDFLGTRDFVDREKIGAIGICGSGGFSLTAAQVDSRIKAVATASMYDISSMIRDGFGYSLTDEQREQTKQQLAEQRWIDFENGYAATPGAGWPSDGPAATLPEGLPEVMSEFFEYYGMERGWHPNTMPNFTLTSPLAFMNFPLMTHLEEISPRPILFIMGENAHSRYYTEEAYEKAAEPKELLIVPGARHIDLYDGGDNNYIPFDKLESFFKENLNQENSLVSNSNTISSSQTADAIFPQGNKGPDSTFTGDVYVRMLVTDPDGVFNTQVYNVEFEPSARTYWHAHKGGQILLVTEGVGYYQEEGGAARRLTKGDVVEIPIGVKHWHGAAPDSHFTHIGMSTRVDEGPAEWLGEVTDEDYNNI